MLLAAAGTAAGEWQRFESSDGGLADNLVLSVLETRSGVLWFATARGISRYDGVKWTTHQRELRAVKSVAEDNQGRLWFGTELSGVVRFDGVSWQTFSTASGQLPVNQVNSVAADRSGDVWCGTPSGLARYQGDSETWTTYTPADGSLIHSNATAVHEDAAGGLWVGSPAGVSRFDPTRTSWTDYPLDPAGLARDSILVIDEDTEGGVWFGTEEGAFRFQNGVWDWFHRENSGLFATSSPQENDAVTAMAADGAGGMWFGGLRRISHYDGRTWRTWDRTDEGTLLNRILSLELDGCGNLWVGTLGTATGNLYRFDRVEWINDFPPNFNMTDILADSRSEIWVTTANRGVFRYSAYGVWSLPTGFPLSSEDVYEDSRQNLWIGLTDAGLMRFEPDRVTSTAFGSESLPGLTVHHVFEDGAGNMWAATNAGVAVFDGNSWQAYLDSSGTQPASQVFETMEDRQGVLWFRSSTGLYRLDPGASEPSRSQETIGTASGETTAFLTDGTGVSWFGTTRGLSRLEAGTWTEYAFLVEPSDTTVHALLEDSQGGIWVGSLRGVTRFRGTSRETFDAGILGTEQIIALFEDAQGTLWASGEFRGLVRYNGVTWRKFDTSDGLGSNVVTHVIQDSRRNLWFASYAAITEHRPDRTAPQTTIISASPKKVSHVRDGSFVYGSGYGEGTDVEYRVSLDGVEQNDWSEEGTWEETNLPDGTHTLELVARDWLRNVDPTPAVFTWEIDATQPPAVLSSPVFGEAVRGAVEIVGTAADPRFRDYVIQFQPVGGTSWTDLNASSLEVTNDVLATWDTTTLPDGFYALRLVVNDNIGLSGIYPLEVMIDNVEPSAEVTAPVTISERRGGDAYSIHGEFHLYFPPGAFSRDVVIEIQDTTPPAGGEGAPDSVLSAAVVSWEGETLRKVATLDARIPNAASEDVSLFHWSAQNGWVRLGGTSRTGQLSAAISDPGTYSIATSSAAPASPSRALALSLTPRIFSPTGGFADTEVAISFNLRRSGPVQVKVFNRAGRLIRRVLDGSLDAGENLVRWDGRNEGGDLVPDGLYIVSVRADGEARQKTVSVVR